MGFNIFLNELGKRMGLEKLSKTFYDFETLILMKSARIQLLIALPKTYFENIKILRMFLKQKKSSITKSEKTPVTNSCNFIKFI